MTGKALFGGSKYKASFWKLNLSLTVLTAFVKAIAMVLRLKTFKIFLSWVTEKPNSQTCNSCSFS